MMSLGESVSSTCLEDFVVSVCLQPIHQPQRVHTLNPIDIMVAPAIALKAVGYTFTLFFMGMCFFPKEMLSGYKLDLTCPPYSRRAPPCDEAKNVGFLWFIMSIVGIQMMSLASICSALARDAVSSKAQSVACFCNMCTMIFFILNDLSYVMSDDYPAAFPKEGVYGNVVLFGTLAGLSYSAWQASGGVMPNFQAIIPKGRFSMPFIAGSINLLFFGLPLCFFRSQFIEMYDVANDSYKALTPDLKYFAFWMFGNSGKFILTNVFMMYATVSAEAGKEDTLYRVMRAGSIVSAFYLGSMSKVGFPGPLL